MKNKTYISASKWLLAVVALIILGSCGKEMNQPKLAEPSHRVIYTSQMFNDNTINVNSKIDFADVSRGITSRTWTFSNEDNVEITGSLTDSQVTGLFTAPGDYTVNLHQVFSGEAYAERSAQPEGAELDTTIEVTVLPLVEVGTITANIYKDGVIGDALSLTPAAPQEIPVGTTVRFSYTAIGDPDQVALPQGMGTGVGHDAENNVFMVKYTGLDRIFDFQAIFGRTAPQSRDTTELYEDFVKCVRSTEPVTLDQVTDKDGMVALVFSRDMDAGSLNPDDFAVTITSKGGSTITPGVSNVTLDADNNSIVLLELNGEQIYSDDNATISYTAGGLQTTDLFLVESFTDLTMVHTFENILETVGYDYSFENTSTNWMGNTDGSVGWLGGMDFTNTLEKNTAQATHGNQSLKISIDPYNGVGPWGNGSLIRPFENGSPKGFDLDPGKYRISYQVYVEENGGSIADNAPNKFWANTRLRVIENSDDSDYAYFAGDPNTIGGTVEGSWREFAQVHTIPDLSEGFYFGITVAQTSSETLTIYVDELKVIAWNPRP